MQIKVLLYPNIYFVIYILVYNIYFNKFAYILEKKKRQQINFISNQSWVFSRL